jgi:hypothetical protein
MGAGAARPVSFPQLRVHFGNGVSGRTPVRVPDDHEPSLIVSCRGQLL